MRIRRQDGADIIKSRPVYVDEKDQMISEISDLLWEVAAKNNWKKSLSHVLSFLKLAADYKADRQEKISDRHKKKALFDGTGQEVET